MSETPEESEDTATVTTSADAEPAAPVVEEEPVEPVVEEEPVEPVVEEEPVEPVVEEEPVAEAEPVFVDGEVRSFSPPGFEVALEDGRTALCRPGDIARFPGRDLERFVGQTLRFQMMAATAEPMLISHRMVQEAEAARFRLEAWNTVKAGDALEGVVTSVRDYGVFVDVLGVEGLIHKTELSWEPVADPSALVHRWDRLTVRVVSLDRKQKRMALTLRDPALGPWARVGTDFVEGGMYPARVVKVVRFGAFVELAPGLEGLVRTANLSWDDVRYPGDAVRNGQEVEVKLLSVEADRQRLDLGIKQATPDPAAVLAERFPVGTEVEGRVDAVQRQGIRVRIDEETVGWLPGKEVDLPSGVLLIQRYRSGSRIKVRVVEVDRRSRQLRFTQTGAEEHNERQLLKEYRKQQSRQDSGLGTLGDLFAGLARNDEDDA